MANQPSKTKIVKINPSLDSAIILSVEDDQDDYIEFITSECD